MSFDWSKWKPLWPPKRGKVSEQDKLATFRTQERERQKRLFRQAAERLAEKSGWFYDNGIWYPPDE